MKTLIAVGFTIMLAIISRQVFGSDCPNGGSTDNGILLFNSPEDIRILDGLYAEFTKVAHTVPANDPKRYQKLLPSLKEMAAFENANGQWTCSGDLYSYNSDQEVPELNAIYILDATTGQRGWANMTIFFKTTSPPPDQ